jgi:hypothetical protein
MSMLLEQGLEANPLPSKNKNLSNSLLLLNPSQLQLMLLTRSWVV